MRTLVIAVSATLLLGGCSLFQESTCPAVDSPGLVVWLEDAATRELVHETRTKVIAFRGELVVELTGWGVPGRYEGLRNREGRWSVRAESPSYQPWSTTGIETRKGDCGMLTVEITAEMVASQPG